MQPNECPECDVPLRSMDYNGLAVCEECGRIYQYKLVPVGESKPATGDDLEDSHLLREPGGG